MVAAAILLSICVAYALAHLALIEVGREVVVFHKWTPGGAVPSNPSSHRTRRGRILEQSRRSPAADAQYALAISPISVSRSVSVHQSR